MSNYLIHPSHPGHQLHLECDNKVYTCAVCMVRGWGPRYSCEKCNYHLHKDCANAVSRLSHQFYHRCTFTLYPPGIHFNAYCVACEKIAIGLVYHNSETGHYLHPNCAYLPHCLEGYGYELRLHNQLLDKCGTCGRDDDSWSYMNEKKNYHFHVSCVNDMAITRSEKLYFREIGTGETSRAPDLQLTRYKERRGFFGRRKISMKEKIHNIAKNIRNLFRFTITGDPTELAILLRSGYKK